MHKRGLCTFIQHPGSMYNFQRAACLPPLPRREGTKLINSRLACTFECNQYFNLFYAVDLRCQLCPTSGPWPRYQPIDAIPALSSQNDTHNRNGQQNDAAGHLPSAGHNVWRRHFGSRPLFPLLNPCLLDLSRSSSRSLNARNICTRG
jgi:hypothetical protein